MNTNAKHSPGPWTIKQATGATHKIFGGPCIADENGNEIAWPVFRVVETNGADNANARLIAASPAMLAALRELLAIGEDGIIERRESGKPIWSVLDEVKKITRAAIAQAEGGAQ